MIQCTICGMMLSKEDAALRVFDGVVCDNPGDPDYIALCPDCHKRDTLRAQSLDGALLYQIAPQV